MAAHGDIDHAVPLGYRHLGGAGRPAVAPEEEVYLIYGDGLLKELNRLVGFSLIVKDDEALQAVQEATRLIYFSAQYS